MTPSSPARTGGFSQRETVVTEADRSPTRCGPPALCQTAETAIVPRHPILPLLFLHLIPPSSCVLMLMNSSTLSKGTFTLGGTLRLGGGQKPSYAPLKLVHSDVMWFRVYTDRPTLKRNNVESR